MSCPRFAPYSNLLIINNETFQTDVCITNTMAVLSILIFNVATTLSVANGMPQIFSNTGGITNIATLSTGPFAIRTVETPSVANTQTGRNALRQRQTEFTHTTTHGGVASPSIFQTSDGRFFALSNGGNSHMFSPGQIFQSADGRFFTIAAVASPVPLQSVLPQEPSASFASQVSSDQSSSLFQSESATNSVIDGRVKNPSANNKENLPSVTNPEVNITTTVSSSTLEPTTIPSTTLSMKAMESVQPTEKPRSSGGGLSSFNNLFGVRTKPLTPSSSLPLTTFQQQRVNQNSISSFHLRKIAQKNKNKSDAVMKNNELKTLDDHILQQKQEAEIQQEQLMQQQLRLQLQRQELQLKRLQQMQIELQEQQEKRQQEILQRHQEKQEVLRMQQEKQLQELRKQQRKQMEELQRQQELEQKAHTAQLRQHQSPNDLDTRNTIVTQTQLIASAPLTPATSRFIAVPAVPNSQILPITGPTRTPRVVKRIGGRRRVVNRKRSRAQSFANLSKVTPNESLPTKIRSAHTSPISSSNEVVSGYYTFPSAGIAYHF